MLKTATLCLMFPVLFAGCQAFDVNVATPEPIKVDVAMDVHVYQHAQPDQKVVEQQATYRSTMDSRRDRMEEVQELKNNRLVGENRRALLEIRNKPAAAYGEYVEETVSAENQDREFLMIYESEDKGVSIEMIRVEQWQHWQRKSFPGEWIEIEEEEGNGHKWIQKDSAEGESDQ